MSDLLHRLEQKVFTKKNLFAIISCVAIKGFAI